MKVSTSFFFCLHSFKKLGAEVYPLNIKPVTVQGIVQYIQLDLSEKASIDNAFQQLPDKIDREKAGLPHGEPAEGGRGQLMGKGMLCTRKDDFATLYEKMIEADGGDQFL